MLYEIKVLKAPWPAGAKVGDVIDMPYLPAWAEGKCNIALDGAEADFTYEPQKLVVTDAAGATSAADALNAQVVELREKLAAAEASNDTLSTEAGTLREKLAAAEAATHKAPKK